MHSKSLFWELIFTLVLALAFANTKVLNNDIKNNDTTGLSYNPDSNFNKIRFPYGVNFKFNGMLKHNFNRVYAVTKNKDSKSIRLGTT